MLLRANKEWTVGDIRESLATMAREAREAGDGDRRARCARLIGVCDALQRMNEGLESELRDVLGLMDKLRKDGKTK